MKNFLLILACAVAMAACAPSYAGTAIDVRNTDGTIDPLEGASGQPTISLLSAEDQANSAFKVEGQFSYSSPKTADYQVKAAAGFVHAISCEGTDGVATAGTIILYDSLTETGNIIWQFDTFATAQYTPFTIILDNVATTGLYLGYTTVADVRCNVSYR